MKKILFLSSMLFMGGFLACNNPGAKDSVSLANQENKETFQDRDSIVGNNSTGMEAMSTVNEAYDDAAFAVQAADGGMLEVQLAKLASSNSNNEKVKEFATMIVQDHEKINGELKQLAGKKDITLPPAPSESSVKSIEKVMDKNGQAFDKEFIDQMVSHHEKDIKRFENASKEASDSEIKAFIDQTLPVLRKHLSSAKVIQEEIK